MPISFDELDRYELYEKDTLIFISYEQKKFDNLDAWGERGAELLNQVESGNTIWTLLWRSGKWYPLTWLAMLRAMCLLSRYHVKKPFSR